MASAGASEVPAEPEKPRVVTRTRRRSATRPAGPPAGAPEAVVLAEPAEPAEPVPAGEPPVVEHVPIKKRGTRKR